MIQPDSLRPRTATELLEQILARDAAPQSATTLQHEQQDPAIRLGAATARYLDALHLAAERLTSPEMVGIGERADRLPNGLTGQPTWPTLRAHLMLAAAAGADPVAELFTAAALPDPMSAGDKAAVTDSQIQDINNVIGRGPLPWLPGIPDRLAADANWGPYLDARSRLVAQLADQVRSNAAGQAPAWVAVQRAVVPAELIADVQVWRAATQVDTGDLRPTGPPQLDNAARFFQQRLDRRLAAAETDADGQWRRLLAREVPGATADPFMPELEQKLSNLSRAGFDATLLLRSAAAAGALPDDHPAAALWWRILDQLPQTPNQEHATLTAVPATRRRTMTSRDRQRPVPRWAPPPAFGPSR